jgi:hypothetical protein
VTARRTGPSQAGSTTFEQGPFLMGRRRVNGHELVGPVVVRGERSAVDTAGVETDGVVSFQRGVVDGVAEEHAVRPVVAVVPERAVVAVAVWRSHRQQLVDGVVRERSGRVDAAVDDERVGKGDHNGKRFEVRPVAVAEPRRAFVAAHDLLFVVSADADQSGVFTNQVDDARTVWALPNQVADEDDEVVGRRREPREQPFERGPASVDVSDDVDPIVAVDIEPLVVRFDRVAESWRRDHCVVTEPHSEIECRFVGVS